MKPTITIKATIELDLFTMGQVISEYISRHYNCDPCAVNPIMITAEANEMDIRIRVYDHLRSRCLNEIDFADAAADVVSAPFFHETVGAISSSLRFPRTFDCILNEYRHLNDCSMGKMEDPNPGKLTFYYNRSLEETRDEETAEVYPSFVDKVTLFFTDPGVPAEIKRKYTFTGKRISEDQTYVEGI